MPNDIEKEAQARFECASQILKNAQEEIGKLGLYFAAALQEHPSSPGIYHALIVLRDVPPEPTPAAKETEKGTDGEVEAEDSTKRTTGAEKDGSGDDTHPLLCPHGKEITAECEPCEKEENRGEAS